LARTWIACSIFPRSIMRWRCSQVASGATPMPQPQWPQHTDRELVGAKFRVADAAEVPENVRTHPAKKFAKADSRKTLRNPRRCGKSAAELLIYESKRSLLSTKSARL